MSGYEISSIASRNVEVIWVRWKGVDDESRAAIIRDAYTEAEGQEYAEDILLATGLTPAEAQILGRLPWKIVPTRKRDDPISFEDRVLEGRKEAANTLLGAKAKDLRYARQEDAEAGLRRLLASVPGSRWTIVYETPSDY